MSAAEQDMREVVAENTLVQLVSKAELDQQIATAHAYPRSLTKFRETCLAMATLNEQVADECIYALPRKEGGQTKMIEGPSARLAEIVASAWGNCRAGARVVDEGRDFVTAQGVFHDLERNVAITYEVRRRITGKNGRYSADMIGVTANAACSIALRNAVFKGVPKAFWADIYEAARRVVAGDSKTLANRRSDALAFLQKLGATQDRVLDLLEVKGVEDITLEHLATLRGIANSIKEGEITVEEAFAPKQDPAAPQSRADQAKAALAGTSGTAPTSGDLAGVIPQFDATSAIAEIKKAKTEAALTEIWTQVAKDFVDTKRAIPIEVEAARNDRFATIKQKM